MKNTLIGALAPKKYCGYRIDGNPFVRVCRPDNRNYRLVPGRSLRLIDHSPTGFEWGYGGSGPAQLALAILLDLTNNRQAALNAYQPFKWDFIADFDQTGFCLTEEQIRCWLAKRRLS